MANTNTKSIVHKIRQELGMSEVSVARVIMHIASKGYLSPDDPDRLTALIVDANEIVAQHTVDTAAAIAEEAEAEAAAANKVSGAVAGVDAGSQDYHSDNGDGSTVNLRSTGDDAYYVDPDPEPLGGTNDES